MLREDINRLSSNLQCFIDLSLFDSNTGESFSKDCLDKDARKQVTACEKALALILGEKDTVDEMSFAECAEILKGLQKDFSAHVRELRDFWKKDTSLIVMEEGQAKAFGEAAKLCEAYQPEKIRKAENIER